MATSLEHSTKRKSEAATTTRRRNQPSSPTADSSKKVKSRRSRSLASSSSLSPPPSSSKVEKLNQAEGTKSNKNGPASNKRLNSAIVVKSNKKIQILLINKLLF